MRTCRFAAFARSLGDLGCDVDPRIPSVEDGDEGVMREKTADYTCWSGEVLHRKKHGGDGHAKKRNAQQDRGIEKELFWAASCGLHRLCAANRFGESGALLLHEHSQNEESSKDHLNDDENAFDIHTVVDVSCVARGDVS